MDILENNKLFLRLGWAMKFESQLNCSPDRFREIFKSNVSSDKSFKGVYFNDKKYRGSIKRQSFNISKTSSTFDSNGMGMYGAEGTYSEIDNKILLNVIVYTPVIAIMLYYAVLLIINIALIINLWTIFQKHPLTILFAILVIIGPGLFFHFTFKNGVFNLTMELDGAFDHWVRKTITPTIY